VTVQLDSDVAVIGLGKIGLPLAVQFARQGFRVYGVDTNRAVVDAVNAGRPPFPGEADLDEFLTGVLKEGRLTATADTGLAVSAASVVVVAVPLLVDNEGAPNFHSIDAATRAIAQGLRGRALVIFETTLPIGTTSDRFVPLLEQHRDPDVSEHPDVVFSPERVSSGRVFSDLRKYPKLVCGVSDEAAERATRFYERALQFDDRLDLDRPNGVWNLGSSEAAEFAKLAETTYRDVNIALANEFARYAMRIGVDFHEIIAACNSQPFSHIHRPGVAVGGHCIPVYPQLYCWTDEDASLARHAREVNEAMPEFAVDEVEQALGTLDGKQIQILGLAYRGGVKEDAFSGAYRIRDVLQQRGATVSLSDPMYTDDEIAQAGFSPAKTGVTYDGSIIQTDHAEYRQLLDKWASSLGFVFDGRNILAADSTIDAGAKIRTLGRGRR